MSLGSRFALTKPLGGGCWVNDVQLSAQVGAQPNRFNIEKDEVQNGSGDKLFDRALAITLSKLTAIFGILPGFAFYNDSDDKPVGNALASQSTRLGMKDGSVVFGKILFDNFMQRPKNPELAIATVCAHEFGHIAQYRHGADSLLIGPDGRVMRLELHADFLAGYFAGKRKLEKPDLPAAVFAQSLFNLGSDKGFGEINYHGTPKDRGDAVVAGFEAAYVERLEFMPAFEKGIRYVLAIRIAPS
jgi:hypothetical protein